MISFNDHDAKHIFEWFLAVKQVAPSQKYCFACTDIEKRLRKFIGKESAAWYVRLVKKYPYFKSKYGK